MRTILSESKNGFSLNCPKSGTNQKPGMPKEKIKWSTKAIQIHEHHFVLLNIVKGGRLEESPNS